MQKRADGRKVKEMMEITCCNTLDLVRCGLTAREVDRALMGDFMSERTLNKLAKAIGVRVEKIIAA